MPQLEWQAIAWEKGRLRIQATNKGLAHARLSAFKLSTGINGKPLPIPGETVYVLPGASHVWVVQAGVVRGTHLHLAAETDSGAIQTDLVVAGR